MDTQRLGLGISRFTALLLSFTVLLSHVSASGTDADPPLADYEGLYEYTGDSTLIISAGPDGLLYAVINGARYPLRSAGNDRFLNAAGDEVLFERGPDGAVSGFREGETGNSRPSDAFALLDGDVKIARSFWIAKPDGAASPYRYATPAARNDGITVAALEPGDPLRASLEDMTTAVYNDAHPYVQSVLVYRRGRLVFEEYFYGYTEETVHQMRSATKTLVAILAGIAIDRGLLPPIDEPILPYFDEYADLRFVDEAKRSITLHDLLSMQSGLACDDWDPDSPGGETRMNDSEDWVRFALDLPMAHEPGTSGAYCSGNVVIVGRMIEKASGKPLREFADETLFGPLGITEYEWDFRPDPSNADNFVQAWMRPRDMLKIGILLEGRGAWRDERIVSAEWIDSLTSPHTTIGGTGYGYFYWLRHLNVEGAGRFETPQISGNGGQKVILLPAQHSIVVTTGGNYNQESNTNELLASFILKNIEPR